MPETISIYCESIEDVSVVGKNSMEVTLADVDLSQLVQDIGFENLLAEMKKEEVLEYFESKTAAFTIGQGVTHSFSNEKGTILEYRDDPQGYNWLVEFVDSKNVTITKDWFKKESLEET